MKRLFLPVVILTFILFLPFNAEGLETSAKGAVVINGETGEIIWEHNSSQKLSMASTTKIMTALLLCENGNLDKQIVTTAEMVTVEGSSMGLLAGDTVSYRDLLYGMMLASGNDAANTTAISLGGSVGDFVDMMNKKAAEIGLKNTNFETPSGLDSAGHYSTALDMALLARYALQNEEFKKASSSMYATLCYGNPPYNRTLKNHNKLLLSYDGLIGVKTGYTKKSGRCLVTAAQRGTACVIAVTLCDPNDWADHKNMLDYGFSQLSERTADANVTDSVDVVGSSVDRVKTETGVVTLSLTESEWQRLQKKVYLPPFVYAGVKSGDFIGRVDYLIDGKTVASADIAAAENAPVKVKKNNLKDIFKILKMLLKAMI